MFHVNKYKDQFTMYELVDEESNSSIKVCPERGGIITSFIANGVETLYLDKETFYDVNANSKGGIPILFPLCGQLPDQKYSLEGRTYTMANHGVARTNSWEVVEVDTKNNASIKIKLCSNENTIKAYPFDFELIFTYILKNNEVIIQQEYINKSKEEMPFQTGFHPYFLAKDKSKIKYEVNAKSYFDHADLCVKPYTLVDMDLSSSKEAKTILDHKGNTMSFSILDLKRKIHFEYSAEFKYMVLWSIVGKEFICVEPWTARVGALLHKEELLYVKPKDHRALSVKIKVEDLCTK